MQLDGLTVSALAAIGVVLVAAVGAVMYALRMLRRTEDRQLTSLRDIVRMVYHGH